MNSTQDLIWMQKEEIAPRGEGDKPGDNFSAAAFPHIIMNGQLPWLLMSPGRKAWVRELGT